MSRGRKVSRSGIFALTWIVGLAGLTTACDQGGQEVYVAVQDFRFTPNEIHLTANRPARLVVRNEGREHHELTSPLLHRAAVLLPSHSGDLVSLDRETITLLPGQSLELMFTPEPGIDEIRCQIKGHAGMRGLLITDN